MARLRVQALKRYKDGGELAGESSFDVRAEVDAVETSAADQTAAHHNSVPAQSGGATTSGSIWNLRGRNVPKVETGADSDQEDVLRIVSSRSLVFQGGASVEDGEQQGGADEEGSLKYNVKKLNGTLETLQRVVQGQTLEIGDLKSLVLTQSKQIETLLAKVDDLKELVSHRSSISQAQHEEQLVGSAAGNGHREEGMSVTYASRASGDQQNSITIGKVETVTRTFPPDYQEDESITSVEVSPVRGTLTKAAVQNNPEQLVINGNEEASEKSDWSDDGKPPSAFPSDQRQVESRVNASDEGWELVQRPHTREYYVSLQRVNPVLRSSAAAGGLSVPATSPSQDEMNSSAADDSDGSHEEGKKLKRRTYNYDHIKVLATNLYQCEFCLKQFRNRGSRRQHDVCKNGLKNARYKCQECQFGFSKKSHYDSHIVRHHSNERPFACPQCPLRFKEKYNVTQHVKVVHLGEKKLRCPHCSKTFARRSHLESHLRIHTGERPYLCEKCSLTCIDSSALAAHMRRAHPSV